MKNNFFFQATVPSFEESETLPQSVMRCTRCAACAQSCPAYRMRAEEAFSPRGRVQLIRLLAKSKINPCEHRPLLEEMIHSCILCARCSQQCAGQLPIAHYMVSLRRVLQTKLLPHSLKLFFRWQHSHPRLFDKLMRIFLFLRRIKLKVLFFLFPSWVRKMDRCCATHAYPLVSLLKKKGIDLCPPTPAMLYLPSWEASYLDPYIAWYTLQRPGVQTAHILLGQTEGLFEYIYGDMSRCLQQAKQLLRKWEKISAGRTLPLLTDSIETYHFLHYYPQLFAKHKGWCQRAKRFAKQVRYVTDFPVGSTLPKNMPSYKTALDTSAVLFSDRLIAEQARKRLHTLLGKNLLQCEYSHFPLPAREIYLAEIGQAEHIVSENMKHAAGQQIRRIYTLSGWAALELDAALKQHNPLVQARHIVYAEADYERLSSSGTSSVS